MGNIFVILQRAFPVIVFIVLQSLSFYTIFSYSDYHNSNLVSRSNYLAARMNEKISDVASFITMPAQNEILTKENARLREEIYRVSTLLNQRIDDTNARNLQIAIPAHIRTVPGKVVSNSVANLRNFIIVNKGLKDGVKKEMAAINSFGPVGLVVDVTENYCCIMSILNKDNNLSVRNRTTKNVGQLRWKGGEIKEAQLEEIPKHIKLKKGEVIETSGYSDYYPAGIPVGVVESYSQESKSNFANVKVKLYNDFSKITYVYLIENSSRMELKAIEDSIAKIQKSEN